MWERLKATGRAIKHRRMTFALVVAFLAIGVVGGLYAIQEGYVPPDGGQTRDGDHAWVEEDFEDQAFCSNCHVDTPGTEILLAIRNAASATFRAPLTSMQRPYRHARTATTPMAKRVLYTRWISPTMPTRGYC